jgi:hypothetical protein
MFERITVSDHVRIAPHTHAALAKGQAVVLAGGALVGFADHDFPADEAVALDIGVSRAVFSAAESDVAGDAAVGSAIYITAAGALTMTATGNTLTGVITDIGGDADGAVSFVKLG